MQLACGKGTFAAWFVLVSSLMSFVRMAPTLQWCRIRFPWRVAWAHGCQNAPENSPHLCATAKERSKIYKWNGSIFILHQPQLRVLPKITFEVTVRLFDRNPCRLVTSQSALNAKTSYEVCGILPKNNMASISAPPWKNICSQQSYYLQTNSSKKGFQFGYSTWIC